MSTRIITSWGEIPHVFKHSKTTIWLRTFIVLLFGIIFSFSLYPDLKLKLISWIFLLIVFVFSLISGFWMSNIVPMQVHLHHRLITFSFDRIYFIIILILVGIKFLSSILGVIPLIPDGTMSIILGMMFGRLGGICLRVRKLKNKYINQ